MLFSIKNHLLPTLLLWMAFVAIAILAQSLLNLSWEMAIQPEIILQIFIGLAAVVASDGILHGLLWATLRAKYMRYYQALVQFFAPQGPATILAGGLLASAEEMVFRGVVLEWIAQGLGWGNPAGILIAALLFALAHLIPTRTLAPFTIWAFWEGVLLGLVYVISGSLIVVMLVHALHDIGGFTLFAFQRRTGWLMSSLKQS